MRSPILKRYNNKKKIVLTLLQNDLISTLFINGLQQLTLDADEYSLHLYDTIFLLMGFKNYRQQDKLLDFYFIILRKAVIGIDIYELREKLVVVSSEVYNELLELKQILK